MLIKKAYTLWSG